MSFGGKAPFFIIPEHSNARGATLVVIIITFFIPSEKIRDKLGTEVNRLGTGGGCDKMRFTYFLYISYEYTSPFI